MSKKLFMELREAELASLQPDELELLNQIEYTKNYEQSNGSKSKRLQGSKKPRGGRKGK